MSDGILATLRKHKNPIVFWFSLLYPFTIGALLYFLMPWDFKAFERTILFCITPVYPLLVWRWVPFKMNLTNVVLTLCGLAVHVMLYTTIMLTLIYLFVFALSCAGDICAY